jgi:hypothetical protein
MTEDAKGLNPGIVRTVAWLNANNFHTTDSGDGETHDFECDREHAYVVIMVQPPGYLLDVTERLVALLRQRDIDVRPIGGDGVCIQATYDPGDRTAVIDVMGLKDSVLFKDGAS